MPQVIVSADDFGFNDATDAAIVELALAGRLTAASCMVLSARWPAAAGRLDAAVRKRIDVGLHLDFTEFDAPASLGALVLRAQLRRLPGPALRAHVRRQLQAFEDALGRRPDYVDGHQHVHQFPQVADALLEELARGAPGPAPWLRSSTPARSLRPKPLLLRWLTRPGAGAQRGLQRFARSRALLGVYGFDLDAAGFRDFLQRELAGAQDGDALMVHPATAALPGDPIGRARVAEHAVLRAADFPQLLTAAGVQPVRGSSLLRAPAEAA